MRVFRTMMGKTLSHYRILEKIGAGGMGEVYRARDERLDREVAVKVLPSGTLTDEAARKRFRHEALALAKLNHPNIETLHEFGTEGGVDFLVMEYVGGVRLEDKLAQGPLPEKEVLRLGQQLTEGLAAAHEQGVIHRDLKPGNLRVTSDGRLKILDFGLAKLLHPDPSRAGAATTESLTGTQGATGTLPYMAPEQLRGEPVDARTDIYSTGVVLYEMATGRRPFLEKLATALADDILHKPAPPPGRLNPDLSSRLEEIIRKCLEKDPQHRYQSPRELLADFRRLNAPPSLQGPPSPLELPGERLDSWKEIGAYLKRDIRTLRRWEKNEGLPVHRHLHEKKASVYAYKAELNAWWNNRRPKLEAQEATEAKEAKERRKRWSVAAAAVVVTAAGVGYWWLAQAPVLPFAERDWVLIAQFENRTGEAVFDGTLEYALERELSNSRFVNVVPRERINDTLQLMKRPLDTTIDHNVGREICLRDGGIRALIAGRVEKLDTTYVLSASLVEPGRGVTVGSFSEEAEGQKEVVAAVRRLSRRVREALGEELGVIQASEPKLEKVTTPSLRALQLYSQADALIKEHRSGEAAALLREAVKEDPEFASAHVLLAHCLTNLTRHKEAIPHFERALALADTTTDRERYFILSSYQGNVLEDEDKNLQTLELLVRLYPDHYWGVTNLSVDYQMRGQPRQALPYALRRADLRPRQFDHQLRAAHEVVVWGDRKQAEPYLQRARELVSLGEVDPWRGAWLRLFPVHERWVQGELEQALKEVTELASEIDSKTEGGLKWQVGSFYLTLGKIRSATEILHGVVGPVADPGLIAWGLGDVQAVRKQLQRAPPSHRSGILLARAGLLSDAEKAIAHPEAASRAYAPFLPFVWDSLARGELALARGQTAEAIRLLEEAVRGLRPWPTSYFFMGAEALARAWEQQGNLPKSLEVLEQASQYRASAVFWGPALFFWMNVQLQRAQLYHKLGREGDAEEVETELRKLLAYADPAHPLLRQLNASRNVAVTQPPK